MPLPFSTLSWRTVLVALAWACSETLALLHSRMRSALQRSLRLR